jgi:hypothetical protein
VPDITDADRAVLQGWVFGDDERWGDLATLDPRLAQIDPCDPFFRSAVHLRVAWRIASGDRELGREAIEIIDPLLAGGTSARDLLLRARACALAGETRGTIRTLFELLPKLPGASKPKAMAATAMGLLDTLDTTDEAPIRRLRAGLVQVQGG